ncbi:hypothetical protein [Thermoflexus sp.]|uniref:hypothetical protein n=1 Tax=Thermoflexus sp. TaxID=1969742 RepID=UPI0025E7A929|nr:hypothetical protein [Thermoflexus sp.]MCS6962429.1 hypothetical protein [Thermoflexus sp.]MCX7690933.1 hypothetical protein [Thermoflexus sp.]MDW8185872.1 hypothetical protein [Anaerolineae bacterium]
MDNEKKDEPFVVPTRFGSSGIRVVLTVMPSGGGAASHQLNHNATGYRREA